MTEFNAPKGHYKRLSDEVLRAIAGDPTKGPKHRRRARTELTWRANKVETKK